MTCRRSRVHVSGVWDKYLDHKREVIIANLEDTKDVGANILNHVRIKGNHCRLHLIMEILISIIEIHMSVYIIIHTRGLGYVHRAVREAGVCRGHKCSRAVTLSHDAGEIQVYRPRWRLGMFLICITWPKHTFQKSPYSVFWHSG